MKQAGKGQVATMAMIFMVIVTIAGLALGFLYSKLPSNNPQASRAGCESVGGDWDTVAERCLVSYKEAGESCVDGGQCISGVCSPPTLSTEERAALLEGPITNVSGTCAASAEVTGCVPQILKGVISLESMCLE